MTKMSEKRLRLKRAGSSRDMLKCSSVWINGLFYVTCLCLHGSFQGLSTPTQTQKSSASRWRTAVWLTWVGWMKPFQMTDTSLKSKPVSAWTAAQRGNRATCARCCFEGFGSKGSESTLLNKSSIHDIYNILLLWPFHCKVYNLLWRSDLSPLKSFISQPQKILVSDWLPVVS